MALDLATELTDAQSAYLTNCTYATDGSASKCALFMAACRKLLILLPTKSASGGGNEINFDIGQIRRELDAARSYYAQANSQPVMFPDFSSFRSQ